MIGICDNGLSIAISVDCEQLLLLLRVVILRLSKLEVILCPDEFIAEFIS